jgi:hypothetical protein
MQAKIVKIIVFILPVSILEVKYLSIISGRTNKYEGHPALNNLD